MLRDITESLYSMRLHASVYQRKFSKLSFSQEANALEVIKGDSKLITKFFQVESSEELSVGRKLSDVDTNGLEFGFIDYCLPYLRREATDLDEKRGGFIGQLITPMSSSISRKAFKYYRIFYVAAESAVDDELIANLASSMGVKICPLADDVVDSIRSRYYCCNVDNTDGGVMTTNDGRQLVRFSIFETRSNAYSRSIDFKCPGEYFVISKIRSTEVGDHCLLPIKKFGLVDISDYFSNQHQADIKLADMSEHWRRNSIEDCDMQTFIECLPGSSLQWFWVDVRCHGYSDERIDGLIIPSFSDTSRFDHDDSLFDHIVFGTGGRTYNREAMSKVCVWQDSHAGMTDALQQVMYAVYHREKVILVDSNSFCDYSPFSLLGRVLDLRKDKGHFEGDREDPFQGVQFDILICDLGSLSSVYKSVHGSKRVFGFGYPGDVDVERVLKSDFSTMYVRPSNLKATDGPRVLYLVGINEPQNFASESPDVLGALTFFQGMACEVPVHRMCSILANADEKDVRLIASKQADGVSLSVAIERQLGDIFG